jgi:hypothetical protein
MTLFQNLILFTNRYGNLQEMLEMASFLKYVDLYLTSEWGRLYVGYTVEYLRTSAVGHLRSCSPSTDTLATASVSAGFWSWFLRHFLLRCAVALRNIPESALKPASETCRNAGNIVTMQGGAISKVTDSSSL